MNTLAVFALLALGTLIAGLTLGVVLHAFDTWNTRRRMKTAKTYRIKY